MTDSETPKSARGFVARTRSVTALVVAAAGLATAIAAMVKPRDDSATKATYEALAIELKTIGEKHAKLHDDMVALRSYVDGYMRGRPDSVVVNVPKLGGASSKPIVVTPPPAPGPKPPDLGPRPTLPTPPEFSELKSQKGL